MLALAASAAGAAAPPQIEPLKLRLLAQLEQPVDLASRQGDARLYVAERTGRVRAIDPNGAASPPILDLSDRVSIDGELGLLGITFSPGGDRLYANYTGGGRQSRLASWAIVEGRVQPATEVQHLALGDAASYHNGGQIAFGPDGLLYWAVGDAKTAANGQDPTTRRGSILRIHPTPGGAAPYAVPAGNPFVAGGGAPEVWAYGLRNPWRFSFDRLSGDLWVADVGEFQREEINRLAAGTAAGANFGWAAFEGTLRRLPLPPANTVAPVHEYMRDIGTSVVGGFVYRGTAIESLRGLYVFGDFGSGLVAALAYRGVAPPGVRSLPFEIPGLVSFGQDSRGELYALAISGEVFKIVSELEPPTPSGSAVPGPAGGPGVSRAGSPRKLVSIVSAELVRKGRMLKVRLRCSPRATRACDGRVTARTEAARELARPSGSVAAGRFRRLPAGTKRVYKLRLRKSARGLLAGGQSRRVNLTIAIQARDGAGVKRTTMAKRRVRVSPR
ncbi:MAG: PQQ-dependent sugar dehydrogenase [Gaiellaceae bacterium]